MVNSIQVVKQRGGPGEVGVCPELDFGTRVHGRHQGLSGRNPRRASFRAVLRTRERPVCPQVSGFPPKNSSRLRRTTLCNKGNDFSRAYSAHQTSLRALAPAKSNPAKGF
jgi:hypothetical protein